MSVAAVSRFERDGAETVVLVVPTSDFPATGSRVESYLAAVHRLLDAAEA